MCGRFTLRANPAAVQGAFNLAEAPRIEPHYNIAPTQQVFALRSEQGKIEPVFLRWGLIPSWAKDPKIAYTLINARSETAAQKPSFRAAFKTRRCLIPADGFYEWMKEGKAKKPMRFTLRDERLFAFAGLWERWLSPEGPAVQTFTILTTSANELVRPLHERMPVILDPARYQDWLDPVTSVQEVQAWMVPWSADDMAMVPANPLVNSPRNQGPELLLAPETAQGA
jgi:putative SOS response-associated peptidase YedK